MPKNTPPPICPKCSGPMRFVLVKTGGRKFRCVDCDVTGLLKLPEVTQLLTAELASRAKLPPLAMAMVVWIFRRGVRIVSLSGYNKQLGSGASGRSVMSGNIFNSNGTRVGVVDGATIFSLNGQELYRLKGINIYRLSGELVGHLNGTQGSDKRLDRSTDKLFSARVSP